MVAKTSRFVEVGAAAALVVALGGAGPARPDQANSPDGAMSVQVDDVGPLAVVNTRAGTRTTALETTGFQAAPVPNFDAEGPPGSPGNNQARLAPKLLSPNELFQGDGYAYGSSQETSQDNRKAAAAGLGLSLPVSQK